MELDHSVDTCVEQALSVGTPSIADSAMIQALGDAELNLLRTPPRFDYAEEEYTTLIAKYPTVSAVYWGRLRAKYGIQYHQGTDGESVAVCYKTSRADCTKDSDYMEAIRYAESAETKAKYESECAQYAKLIQDWTSKTSDWGFDIFLSCEESAPDSVSAMTELYTFLTQRGHKVFFAPITLGKSGIVGAQSEPYIFRALESAKVMVVYGERQEQFCSAWVQSEWLSMHKTEPAGRIVLLYDKKKVTLRDLPSELAGAKAIDIHDHTAYERILAEVQKVMPTDSVPAFGGNALVGSINTVQEREGEHNMTEQYGVSQYVADSDTKAILTEGMALVYQGKYESAYQLFSRYSGDLKCEFGLDYMIYYGYVAKQNQQKALAGFERKYSKVLTMAESGEEEALLMMALYYDNGFGVTQDKAKAGEWYNKAAMKGNVVAQNRLGNIYYKGIGVEQNFIKAVWWYTKAAEQDDSEVQYDLANMYYNGDGINADRTKAMYWYDKSAELGNPLAQNKLAEFYFNGECVKQDYGKAVEWYTKAALQGNQLAQNKLGNIYYKGECVKQDYEKAVEWYTKAALQGNSSAQYNLGVCYNYGYGVKQDFIDAIWWYTNASEQGDMDALYRMGECYMAGQGVKQNYAKAMDCFVKAAEQGNSAAQHKLGNCYYTGDCVKQDTFLAAQWYAKAAMNGNKSAKAMLRKRNIKKCLKKIKKANKKADKQ